jgi:hypothetical protein
MRLPLAYITIAALGANAWAGPALDEDKKSPPPSSANSPETPPTPADAEEEVDYGVGIRLRSVYIPSAIMGLFVARNSGGAQNYGIGAELIRRHGSTELQLGFEFEHIQLAEGVYIERGKEVPGDESDYILSPDHANGNQLGWFTIDFTFVNHVELGKGFQFRYGGGAGIGIITGELDHFNIICAGGSSNNNVDPGCVPPDDRFTGKSGQRGTGSYSDGGSTPQKYDLPPVFPVVNAIIGIQYRPNKNVTINVEGGIRTLPFLGLSGAYFF